MGTSAAIYRPVALPADAYIRQGEIVSNLVQTLLDLATLSGGSPEFNAIAHRNCIVVSQDCELLQDWNARGPDGKATARLSNILFCPVHVAAEFRKPENGNVNSELWRRLRPNNLERFQYLRKVDPEFDALNEGLNELIVDFKQYFTLPTEEVYYRIGKNEAQRRCVLCHPWREQFSTRFASFIGRIALPEEHYTGDPKN